MEEAHPAVENEEESREEEVEIEPIKRLEEPDVEEEPVEPKPVSNVQGCQHHFGYLGDRSSKEKIPDECITCENIVKCMLKNIAT